MTTWIVSRHEGAVEWLLHRGFADACHLPHLDPDRLLAGDTVIGTLPVSLVAELSRRGVDYHHLTIPMPAEYRGRELTADELDRLGARIERYTAHRFPE